MKYKKSSTTGQENHLNIKHLTKFIHNLSKVVGFNLECGVDLNNKLNKRWACSLGVSSENSILELIEHLVMAKNSPKPLKAGYLIKASACLEVAMMKIRLLLEFKLVNETRIFQLQSNLAEIGKMLGGWLKSTYSQ